MDPPTLEITKSFCSKFSKTTEQEQSRVPDAERAACTHFHTREKEQQLSVRGWMNYELVGTSIPAKKLLPLKGRILPQFLHNLFHDLLSLLDAGLASPKLALERIGQ